MNEKKTGERMSESMKDKREGTNKLLETEDDKNIK
jgi:hypothetical protein